MLAIFSEIFGDFPIKVRYTTIYILGAFTIALPWLMSCSYLKELGTKYPHDNVIEEITEMAIEHYTDLDLDLTPSSPEN